ncbi:Nucleosome assembly protein 1-like 1 [Triticum urartu]|uniref:Nucleosome assembly protein 1-like 1 n=1 Tax=Triticum urartu TaxID=4572 RepID=M8A9P7_TRIUA|nr:Nucleosome assembly protein 1-like 1 [Triticum urartu]
MPISVRFRHAWSLCVRAVMDKLQSLAGQHADVLESLSPNVRTRVEFLRGIQISPTYVLMSEARNVNAKSPSQHDEIEAKFFEERAALEAKYRKLYEPLYAKTYDIVHCKWSCGAKGVPDFWLTALKTNEVMTEEIQERDEPVLKYLKDIKWSRIDDPKGFKLLTARAAAESGSKRTCAAELHNLSDKVVSRFPVVNRFSAILALFSRLLIACLLDWGAAAEEQDQREDEGVAEPDTQFQQGRHHKTNKASMLDETIEYLKQLQLQV